MASLPVLSPPSAQQRTRGELRAVLLRLYRLAVVVAIVWIVHRHYARLRIDGDAPIRPDEVKVFFPTATSLQTDESDRMGLFVADAHGNRVGYVLRTSPVADKITGYSGPTDTLIAMDPAMRVVGIRIRSSWDTREHVRNVAEDRYFMKLWNGKTWDQIAGTDPKTAGIEGVSGASLTSLAIANGIHYRFQQIAGPATSLPRPRLTKNDWGLLAVLAVAFVFTFTNLRGHTWLRRAFQVVLIGYVGFWNGQLLAQSLWAGWSSSSVPWRVAPALVLLAAAALVVPWTSRRALYCSHVCPHGAAQELLGRVKRRKLRLPHGVDAGLRWLPPMLVALVLIVTLLRLPLNLAAIEPFDAYLIRHAGTATIAVAVVGLVASLFVPMAYCKYGCPTGLVLNFVRSHGRADRFGRRDAAAGAMVLLALALYLSYGSLNDRILHGRTPHAASPTSDRNPRAAVDDRSGDDVGAVSRSR